MWEAFDADGAYEMYLKLAPALSRQARMDLAREIAVAAFGPTNCTRATPFQP